MATLPLATPKVLEPLLARAADPERMRSVLEEKLAPLTAVPLRVTSCTTEPLKSRRALKEGRLRIAYDLETEWPGGGGRHRLLGILPVERADLDADGEWNGADLRGHPALAPFETATLYIDEMQMALTLFPFDPGLPGLATLTGPGGAGLLEAILAADGPGRRVEELEWELSHYKPCNRAVVRVAARLTGGEWLGAYLKIFADDRGAANYRDFRALWKVARRASALRVPEPLGYDGRYRVLAMAEVPGRRELTDWIRCLEKGQPLPAGVDRARLETSLVVAAEALAELHGSSLRLTRRRTIEGEIADLAKDFDLMVAASPALARELEEIAGRLRRVSLDPEPMVPAHGGYRHKQMVGDERTLTVIDWDGLTMANPALDVATFERRLLQEPLRRPGEIQVMSDLANIFRDTYCARRPAVPRRHMDLYLAVSLTENALRSVRRPKDRDKVATECRSTLRAVRALLERAAA